MQRSVRSAPKPTDYLGCSQAKCQRKSDRIAELEQAIRDALDAWDPPPGAYNFRPCEYAAKEALQRALQGDRE